MHRAVLAIIYSPGRMTGTLSAPGMGTSCCTGQGSVGLRKIKCCLLQDHNAFLQREYHFFLFKSLSTASAASFPVNTETGKPEGLKVHCPA